MKLNQFHNSIKIIILLLYLATLNAKVHAPIGSEEDIKLTIHGKELTYYELDNGLIYDDIGKQYDIGDSIQIGIYSRTIKASTGKKKRNYGSKGIKSGKPVNDVRGSNRMDSPGQFSRPEWI